MDNPDIMREPSTIDTKPLGDDEAPARPGVAGVVPFPAREGVAATNDLVDALREIEGI